MEQSIDHGRCGGPDRCFTCKLRYWRSSGHSPFAAQPSEFFTGPTQMQLEREIVESAKAEGREIKRASSVWV